MRTYGSIKLEDGFWIIEKAEPHICIRLKQLFPRIPKTGILPYKLARTIYGDADLEWFTSRYPLDISEADRMAMRTGHANYLQQQAEMEQILQPGYVPGLITGIKDGQTVRPYQQQAIDLLRRRRKLLLGDEGGLGKTYTAGAFLCAEPTAMPAAVVCDAHLAGQWKEKLESFTHLRVHEIKGTKVYELPVADVYVFRITQLAGWVDLFSTGFFKAAIYDEPQNLRTGRTTNKGAAAWVLSTHTDFHLGLTATPIYGYGEEMFNVMQFIDDQVLGDRTDFYREWCPTGKIIDPKALGTYLREQFALLRRLKSDVGLQLPRVSRIVEHISYDEKAVAAVEDLAHQLAIKATTGSFIERGNAARELDVMMRQTTGVAKAKTVAMFVRMLVEAGEPVVVWGWHREVYEIWNAELADLKPAMYTGSETSSQKNKELARFLDRETDIIFMSLRSGAGIDGLQFRACTGVFGELDWAPGIHEQCIWRLDREGQDKPVTAFFLVTDDGSDPPMMDVLGIKASEATQIVDPDLGIQTQETDVTNLRRLVARYLDKKGKK